MLENIPGVGNVSPKESWYFPKVELFFSQKLNNYLGVDFELQIHLRYVYSHISHIFGICPGIYDSHS
jgi:hypothetical protein